MEKIIFLESIFYTFKGLFCSSIFLGLVSLLYGVMCGGNVRHTAKDRVRKEEGRKERKKYKQRNKTKWFLLQVLSRALREMSHIGYVSFLISNHKQNISSITRFEFVKGQYIVNHMKKHYST